MKQVAIRVREVAETFREEEFKEWREHPVTVQFLKYLSGKREELKENWATGGFTGPSLEETAIRNAGAVGAVSVLDEIISLDATFLSEDE